MLGSIENFRRNAASLWNKNYYFVYTDNLKYSETSVIQSYTDFWVFYVNVKLPW